MLVRILNIAAVLLFSVLSLKGEAMVKAGLVPKPAASPEKYLSEANASLRRWQAVIAELNRAGGDRTGGKR